MADKRVIEQTASSELYNDDWFLKDSVLEGTTKISKDNLIDKIGASKIKSIAEDYDSTSTYNKDDFAFYENKLYRCLANNTTGTWDGTKWEEFDLPTALITTAHNIETAEFTIGTYYSADDLVLKDGKLYQCVVGHNATEWKTQFWRSVTIDEMLGYLSDSIAPEHNQSTVYAVGDLVMHNKILWRCIQAGAGAFVNANWEEVTVVSLIAEAGQIDDVQVKTTGDYETVVENKIAKIDLSSVTAYGEVPNLPQAIATFKDGADAPLKELKVAIEPQQDLHGYDSPWAGGAGKNKLAMNISDIKSLNTTGTWNGDTYTVSGAEYKINIDTAGNLTSINVRSVTINPNGDLKIATTLPANSYILSSGFTEINGGNDTFLQKDGVTIARGNNSSPGPNFTITESSEVVLHIRLSRNNSSFICTPMIRLSSVTDATFAPYSNICPIIGWDEADVSVCGNSNLLNPAMVNKTSNSLWKWYDTEGFRLKANTKYSLTNFTPETNIQMYIKDLATDNALVSSNNFASYTPTSDMMVYFQAYRGDGIADSSIFQLEIGDRTSYHAYNGSTYTIPFVDEQGQSYECFGGTFDVVNGSLDENQFCYKVTSDTSITKSGDYFEINNVLDDDATANYEFLSSFCKRTTASLSNMSDNEGRFVTSRRYLAVKLPFSTVEDVKTYLTSINAQIVYKLPSSTTLPQQPTSIKSLDGDNNVWADTGDINDCVYRRDMTSTIDDIIARIEALENA